MAGLFFCARLVNILSARKLMQIPYRSCRRVQFRDTDAAGIMHFSTFFTYMEEVEHEFLRTLGSSVVQPLTHSGDPTQFPAVPGGMLSWPRVAAECQFHGAARFEDELEIELRVLKLGTSSITYGFQFRIGTRDIAAGSLTAVFCQVFPGQPPKPIPIPSGLREQLATLVSV